MMDETVTLTVVLNGGSLKALRAARDRYRAALGIEGTLESDEFLLANAVVDATETWERKAKNAEVEIVPDGREAMTAETAIAFLRESHTHMDPKALDIMLRDVALVFASASTVGRKAETDV